VLLFGHGAPRVGRQPVTDALDGGMGAVRQRIPTSWTAEL
jgi:hypothetical protein